MKGVIRVTHDLKTDPKIYEDMMRPCSKNFEIRKDDRGFKVHDFLRLKQTKHTGKEMAEGKPLVYTGKQADFAVGYILRGSEYGLMDGYVAMALSN